LIDQVDACDNAAPCEDHGFAYALCGSSGEHIVSGGYKIEPNGEDPFGNGVVVVAHASYPDATSDPDAWVVDVQNPTENDATNVLVHVWAICST
jgi:hypothetical protein